MVVGLSWAARSNGQMDKVHVPIKQPTTAVVDTANFRGGIKSDGVSFLSS